MKNFNTIATIQHNIMKTISLVILFILLFPPLINGSTGPYPVDPDIYKELINLRNLIASDAENLIEITNKSSSVQEKDLLKTVSEHYKAVDTELATFITLLPVESYHDLSSLLDKPYFDNTTHSVPALEYINVQCVISISYLNKKINFIRKQISVTDSRTILIQLGKLDKHIETAIKTLNDVNTHLDLLLNQLNGN